MTFFNTKEEAIDIELTPYGKFLLSQGKFKPVYYEFYDDDIIYDSQYADIDEKQSEIKDRIRDTKRIKTQYTFESAENRQREVRNSLLNNEQMKEESFLEKRKDISTNFLPLGNSSLIKEKLPSITLKFFSGEITGSIEDSTVISLQQEIEEDINIKRLPNNIKTLTLKDLKFTKFKDYLQDVGEREYNFNKIDYKIQKPVSNKIFQDSSFISVIENEIFLEIVETNVDDNVENFEISLFEILEDGTEVQLSFEDVQEENKIENNILKENEDYQKYIEMKNQDLFLKSEYVNSYFDIMTDKEIDSDTLCYYLPKSQIERLKIVEGYDIQCDNKERIRAFTNNSFDGNGD